MTPTFPKLLCLSALIILGLLTIKTPGYLKFASPQQLANLSQKMQSKPIKSNAKPVVDLCPVGNTELDKKLKNLGVNLCKTQ